MFINSKGISSIQRASPKCNVSDIQQKNLYVAKLGSLAAKIILSNKIYGNINDKTVNNRTAEELLIRCHRNTSK